MAQLPLVFTDLDGSLLDHDSYSFEPAVPALRRLAESQVAVIPATSKTAAEVAALNQTLQQSAPFIFENGSGIGAPRGMFPELAGGVLEQGYELRIAGATYEEIVAALHSLRGRYGYRFDGFADWSVKGIANRTGLTMPQAVAAQQRMGSEPILWHDTGAAYREFVARLAERKLHPVRGGRFISVQGPTSKASGMRQLAQLYSKRTTRNPQTIAIGDSPNDRDMLEAADVAIVILGKSGRHLELSNGHPVYRTRAAGPTGWREGIDWLYENIIQ